MNVNRKTPVYFLGILAILTALFVVVVEAYKVRASADSANADLDKIFADVSRPGSPGCALGIFRNGQIIYEKGYGLASVELNAPITPESVFDIRVLWISDGGSYTQLQARTATATVRYPRNEFVENPDCP